MKRIVFGILTAGTAALTLAASPAHAEEYRGGYYDHGNCGREATAPPARRSRLRTLVCMDRRLPVRGATLDSNRRTIDINSSTIFPS